MITLLVGLSDNRRKGGQEQRISIYQKRWGQTKAAAAEVEEVGQDSRSAKHRLLRPVCVEGRAKDSKKVRVRL